MTVTLRREPAATVFDDLLSDFFNRTGWQVATPRSGNQPTTAKARMDVLDKGDRYEVLVDLPGMTKDDIRVNVEGARVEIAAESKREKTQQEGERVLHSERYVTAYTRSFELPSEVSQDNAEAAFENGVLKLALPKRAQAQSTRVQIK